MTREIVKWALGAALGAAAHLAVWLAFARPNIVSDSDAGSPVVPLELSPVVTAPSSPSDETEPETPTNVESLPTPGNASPEASPPRPTEQIDPPKQATQPPPATPPPPTVQPAVIDPEPPSVAQEPAPEALPPPPPQTDQALAKEAATTVEPPPPIIPPGAPPSAPSTASNHLADIAAAPASTPGSEEAVSPEVLHRWRQELIAQIERHKRFPIGAQGHAGIASVAFTIDEKGKLISLRIVASSGSPALDEAALDLIRRAEPFPAPPENLAPSELSFVAPIRYLSAVLR